MGTGPHILIVFVLVLPFYVGLGWVLPIILGIQAAKKKGYSPKWMWFGIHPAFAWIACILLLCAEPTHQCRSCGGFVKVNFRICPYCHAGLERQSTPQQPSP